MSETAKNKITYDDLLALPENMVGEILGGDAIEFPLSDLWAEPPPARAEDESKET